MTAAGVERTLTDHTTPITGWQAGCSCTWVGATFHEREPGESEYPTDDLQERMYREWVAHIAAAMPDWAVQEAAKDVARTQQRLDEAAVTGRLAGLSWERVAEVAAAAGVAIDVDEAKDRWGEQVRIACEPIDYTYGPDTSGAQTADADIANRAVIAKRRGGGRPLSVWSTGERLAVALVLHDHVTLDDMGHSWSEAITRVRGGARDAQSGADPDVWLDRIRTLANDLLPTDPETSGSTWRS